MEGRICVLLPWDHTLQPPNISGPAVAARRNDGSSVGRQRALEGWAGGLPQPAQRADGPHGHRSRARIRDARAGGDRSEELTTTDTVNPRAFQVWRGSRGDAIYGAVLSPTGRGRSISLIRPFPSGARRAGRAPLAFRAPDPRSAIARSRPAVPRAMVGR